MAVFCLDDSIVPRFRGIGLKWIKRVSTISVKTMGKVSHKKVFRYLFRVSDMYIQFQQPWMQNKTEKMSVQNVNDWGRLRSIKKLLANKIKESALNQKIVAELKQFFHCEKF